MPDPALPRMRLPVGTFAIPLGLAGLAQVWSVATTTLGAPFAIAQAFWVVAALAWAWILASHVHRGRRVEQRLVQQLTHVTHGPMAGLPPISAMLIGPALYRTLPAAGLVLTLSSLAAAAGFGAWMLSFWVRAGLSLESVHAGYYLPISATGLVGALVTSSLHIDWLALGSFAVGALSWLVVSAFLVLRLARRPALPTPLVPTLAIMAAPPAVASAAWLAISAGRPDTVFYALTALTICMVLVQVALLPRYRRVPFSLTFWSFTFPAASVTALAVTWLHLMEPRAWREATVALVAALTLLVGAIATKSLLLARGRS